MGGEGGKEGESREEGRKVLPMGGAHNGQDGGLTLQQRQSDVRSTMVSASVALSWKRPFPGGAPLVPHRSITYGPSQPLRIIRSELSLSWLPASDHTRLSSF